MWVNWTRQGTPFEIRKYKRRLYRVWWCTVTCTAAWILAQGSRIRPCEQQNPRETSETASGSVLINEEQQLCPSDRPKHLLSYSQHGTQRDVRMQVSWEQFKSNHKLSQIIELPECIIYPIINLLFTSGKSSKYVILPVSSLKYEPSIKCMELQIVWTYPKCQKIFLQYSENVLCMFFKSARAEM